jgi:hypothetical protein
MKTLRAPGTSRWWMHWWQMLSGNGGGGGSVGGINEKGRPERTGPGLSESAGYIR